MDKPPPGLSSAPNSATAQNIQETDIEEDPQLVFDVKGKENEEEEAFDVMPILMEVTCQKWVKIRSYIGIPLRHDFKLEQERLPYVRPGEILIQALCWTVDNYMKVFDIPLYTLMPGEQVACVISTDHKDFPIDTLVVCATGWRTHSIVNPDLTLVRKVKDLGDQPISLCLGTLGLPGLAAYFGLLHLCKPVEKDIVVVNSAAGPMGNVVAQIAKILGCIVIGFASTNQRCEYLRSLGLSLVFNNRTMSVSSALSRMAPMGVDCYFDCVGGEFTSDVLEHLKPNGRMCMCGQVVTYCRNLPQGCIADPYKLIRFQDKQVTTHSLHDFQSQFDTAEDQLLEWIHQGKLKCSETLLEGFGQLPTALTRLYDDDTVGKIIVKSEDAQSLYTTTVQC